MKIQAFLLHRFADLGAPRGRQALRSVLAVALAVWAAHRLDLHEAWWAAISAFAVTQAHLNGSLYRGVLRILGTVAGGLAGYAGGLWLSPHLVPFVLACALVTWGTLHMALVGRHSYAWVLGGVTFVMVMCDAVSTPIALLEFAMDRVLNVVLGTVACLLVAVADHGLVRWLGLPPAAAPPAPVPLSRDRRQAMWQAAHAALAVALLALAVKLYPLGAMAQAMVTTVAVLVVPPGPGALAPQGSVMQRMRQRLAGCLMAGLVAALLLPLIEGHALACQFALALGVWLGAWMQGSSPALRYAAIQFAIAFIMVFVQDRGWTVNEQAAAQRFAGMLAGVLVLALIVRGVSAAAAARARPSAPGPGPRR